ncbi:hypothetical protein [Xenorhabdus innexi]|uniref:Uncharacterized protein n=1 Tax=Xenorhabdus innexi TaxID=290109 RepID=A0A1N6MUR0_9GAMM|nr:hypothetical protein [Xenorhabdus innexi]PHM31142.1 hypothetical protein Xinn_03042 [Xenorhabdus innexi]SIP72598.1 conserved hypothetical protein [Xenorhabdus innexi]
MAEFLSPASVIPSILDLRAVGLLGELRAISATNHLMEEVMVLPGVVAKKQNILSSRGFAYYEPKTCDELLATVKYYADIIIKLQCTDKQCAAPSKYILADHCLVKLLRIIDSLLNVPQMTNEDIVPFIDGVKVCAEIVCSALMGSKSTLSSSLLQDLKLPTGTEHQIPRTYIEGDNHLLTLAAAQIDACPNSSVIGVMLGGAATAAVTAAAWNSELNLVKVSRYDDACSNSHHIWGRNIPSEHSVSVIDDNCGTGDTLRQVRELVITRTGIRPKLRATELHWEKLLRTCVYGYSDRVFSPESLDVLTPWCFRHHKVLNNLVNQLSTDESKYAHTTTADWVNYSYSLLSVLHDTLKESTWAPELLKVLSALRILDRVSGTQPIDAFRDIAQQCPECLSRNRESGSKNLEQAGTTKEVN